jgi:heat shock protein HslJ
VSPILAAGVLVAAALSYACSDLTGPSTVSGTTLAGPWALIAQQPAGQPEAAPPGASTFGFEIVDGRAAVTADCNRCNGSAMVEGSTLTMGPALACTRAYCASAPYDDTFLRLLADRNAASIDGEILTLRSERGMLRFKHGK